ncbi:MAG: AmmeMemoRadiSam system protein B [Verrucomicrobia bacterium]|nr:AmmeMemoRadiSam system protein B [Verrucomicrobiota bacterium]
MSANEKPRLRPIEAFPFDQDGRQLVVLRDPLRWTENSVVVSPTLIPILQRFTGENTVVDIQAEFARATGQILPSEALNGVIAKLDEALLLDNERFQHYRDQLVREYSESPVRPATHAGASYPGESEALAVVLNEHLAAAGGPDGTSPLAGQLIGLIAPHIDLRRGGPTFARAYRQLHSRTDIELFVILGTGHQPMHHRFGGLRKDYETPFGTARTDRDALESLAAELPFGFFDDEWAHRSEHSIEFQVVWLQHIFGGNLKAGIVPVLAGSFHEFSETGASPLGDPQVAGFTQALRKLVEARRGKVCIVAGVDFAHVGGRFGDEEAMDEARRTRLERDDRAMLDAILSCDAEKFHHNIAADKDARRICGYPAIYALLASLQPATARLLDYGQSHETETNSVVSFGSVAFYR